MTPAETVSRWAMFLDKPIEVEDAIAALVKAERERAAIPSIPKLDSGLSLETKKLLSEIDDNIRAASIAARTVFVGAPLHSRVTK